MIRLDMAKDKLIFPQKSSSAVAIILLQILAETIHQPFSRTFFAFSSEIYKLECDTTSD